MVSPCIWMVVFAFVWKIKAVNGMDVSTNIMTWLESFSYCSLASEDKLQSLNNGEYRGWAGGIYLNSQWMINKGCYIDTGATDSNGVVPMKKLTPSLCSDECKTVRYFALKQTLCFCLNSLYQLTNIDPTKCTFKCPGSHKDMCGGRYYYTVYRQITGKFKPKSDVDQKLTCSVVVPRNNSFVLKAVGCFSKYWTVCLISGVTRQMEFTDTYELAIIRCSSLNGTIRNVNNNLDNLEDGKEYWSNIYRSKFLRWITNESFEEIYDKVDRLLNTDCLFLEVQYMKMRYLPIPCDYEYKAICESKKTGYSTVTRQCQSKKRSTVLSISDSYSITSSLPSTTDTTTGIHAEYTSLVITLDSENRTLEYGNTSNGLTFNVLVLLVAVSAALFVIIIMTVLLIVRNRRKRRKVHTEGIGHHFELGTPQPIIKNENRTYEMPWYSFKSLETGIPECQIYDEADDQEIFERQVYDVPTDQYQHLQFDLRRKQPKFLEAEYDSSMSILSFPNPDIDKTAANSAIKIVVAKRAQNMRSSIHVDQGQKTNNKSTGQNVAYCDSEIIHTKYLYDTPKQYVEHANIP